MSKSMIVLFVVVSVLSTLLVACDNNSNTCVSQVYDAQGNCMVRQPTSAPQVAKPTATPDFGQARQPAADAIKKGVGDLSKCGTNARCLACEGAGNTWYGADNTCSTK